MADLKIEFNKDLQSEYTIDADKQAILRLHKLSGHDISEVDGVKLTGICSLEDSVSLYTGSSVISIRVVSGKILGEYSAETAWQYYQEMCFRYINPKDISDEDYDKVLKCFADLKVGDINNEQALEILIRIAILINHREDTTVNNETNILKQIYIGMKQKFSDLSI